MGISQRFGYLNPVRELELSYHDKATENKQMIYCDACKAILRRVIKYIGKTASKDEVNRQLDRICKRIRIRGCTRFLQKYKNKLVIALLSGDKASTICIKLKMCRRMYVQTIH
uniref:NK-lysin antimicrobial peptide type 3 n=1 Tax=Sinocrossocheilus bamaensis TaxID=369678 RepID=A0A5Q0TSA7_9TELE|nr:NK-lysin antimicrobial peptide type 3 [Sinocrossocheilus bamaensis]